MIALHLCEASRCTLAVTLSSKNRFYGVRGIVVLCHGGAQKCMGVPKTNKQNKTALYTSTSTRTVLVRVGVPGGRARGNHQ